MIRGTGEKESTIMAFSAIFIDEDDEAIIEFFSIVCLKTILS